MIRGTTPKHTFTLPFHTDIIDTVYITYRQECCYGKNIVIERGKDAAQGLDNCTFDGDKIIVELTQEETLAFMHGVQVAIQIRVKTTDGQTFNVLASEVIKVSVNEILKDGVI